MKKIICLLFLVPWYSFSQAPYNIENVGLNDDPYLNEDELAYTEYVLTHHYSDSVFSLNGQKVLFLSSTYGSTKRSKSLFFNRLCKPWTSDGDMPLVTIVRLTEEESVEIGYDTLLVAWSKIAPEGRARKKFIKSALQYKDV